MYYLKSSIIMHYFKTLCSLIILRTEKFLWHVKYFTVFTHQLVALKS